MTILALVSCTTPVSSPAPSRITPRVVTANMGDITSVLVLDGTIVAILPIAIKVPERGTVTKVFVAPRTVVKTGGVLFKLHPADGSKVVSVTSPQAGTVVSVDVLPRQAVEVGVQALLIAPDGFQAVAAVNPSLLYRFGPGPPPRIAVKVSNGPAPFDCTFLSLGLPAASPVGSQTSPELRCTAPAGVQLFTGSPCLIAATLGSVKNVVVVPITAVEGTADTGYVTVVTQNGSYSRKLVKLGLTDGVNVQIVEGLEPGDKVLDPPPSIFSDPIVNAQAGQVAP